MAGAAQLDRDAIGNLGREDDDRVAQCATVFCRSKRHDVDARSPSRVSGATPKPRQSVGKTRPVHVKPEAAPLGYIGHRSDLVERTHGAEIGGLRQTDCNRLASVELGGGDAGQSLCEQIGADFPMLTADRRKLQAAAKEPGRIRLGSIDVGDSAAINDTPRGAERGQSQRIGRGPGGDRKHPYRSLEQLGKALLQRGGALIPAIPQSGVVIGLNKGLEYLRCRPAGIVAAIVDHFPSL